MQGKVITFNKERGYGFIRGDDNCSYFVHHSKIKMSGYRYLEENQKVSFKASKNDKGLLAVDVEVLV